MDKLQSGKLELKNGNFSAPWPFKLIRVPLTIENINSGAAYTNQGKLYIYSSSIDIQELIYAFGAFYQTRILFIIGYLTRLVHSLHFGFTYHLVGIVKDPFMGTYFHNSAGWCLF